MCSYRQESDVRYAAPTALEKIPGSKTDKESAAIDVLKSGTLLRVEHAAELLPVQERHQLDP
jgi:hypothetical protein